MATLARIREMRVVVTLLLRIEKKLERYMSTLTDRLDAIEAKLTEASTEIPALVQQLRDSLSNNFDTLPDEVTSRLDALDSSAAGLANIVPDAPAADSGTTS